ncbi:MAG: serine/threonine protein kinase [Planctomycetes bacterium]|nr:serine/threonine protein kinase [Planctomycetota bacterium]
MLREAREAFGLAIEADPNQRDSVIARVCGDNELLRRAVMELLEAHDNAHHFMAHPESASHRGPGTDTPPTADLPRTGSSLPRGHSCGPGDRLGSFVIEREIGRGGFGTVFFARQEQPVRRVAAVKVIHSVGNNRQVLARFEQERQALASMSHPHVASVLEGGATDDGLPYFAMEYIHGEPITVYCDRHRLTTSERLRLFCLVCDAVQHAHQKGIIHRDIKPSNVLVYAADGKHIPKVIDFGIAKVMGERLIADSIHTDVRSFVGTPEYMSPEQADPRIGVVDTRSDIYSLGVLLYELLIGVPPLDSRELRAAPFLHLQHLISEVDPPTPSSRLTSQANLADIAHSRRSNSGELPRLVRGDLDHIAMKALEKPVARRYATAAEFAADIHRYLNQEPVLAAPPSRLYKLSKFVRRNRAASLFACVAVLAIAAGFASAVAGYFAAEKGRVQAIQAKASAERSAANALRSGEILKAVTNLMVDAPFRSLHPEMIGGGNISVREYIDRVAQRAESEENPSVRGMLLSRMAKLSLFADNSSVAAQRANAAIAALERDPQADPKELAEALATNAVASHRRGDITGSLASIERACALALQAPAAEGKVIARYGITRVRALQELNRPDEALSRGKDLLEEIALLPPDPINVELDAGARWACANVLQATGKYDEAIALIEKGIGRIREATPKPRQRLADLLDSLGQAHLLRDHAYDATPLFQEAYDIRRDVLPADHPMIAVSLQNFSENAALKFRGPEAVNWARRALEILDRRDDGPSMARAEAFDALALALTADYRSLDAYFAYEAAEAEYASLPTPRWDLAARSRVWMASSLIDRGEIESAERMCRFAVEFLSTDFPNSRFLVEAREMLDDAVQAAEQRRQSKAADPTH